MKRILLTLTFFVLVLNAIAQKLGKELYKPISGAKGVTIMLQAPNPISINSVHPPKGLVYFKYMLTDNISLRGSLGYKKDKFKYEGVSSGGIREKFVGDTTGASISLGIQKSFGYNAKLDPYLGIEFMYGIGRAKYNDAYHVEDPTIAGGSKGDVVRIVTGKDTPINKFGLMPVMGFNSYMVENFAIGAEMGWGIVRTNFGHLTEHIVTPSGVTDTSTKDKSSDTATGTGIIRLTISAFF
jgi:hypothetical protein